MATQEKDKLVDKDLEKKKVVSLKSLNSFSQLVTRRMILDNIPPTPINYHVYFEKLLTGQSSGQRKAIQDILDLENETKSDHLSQIEKDAKDSFVLMKSMTSSISIIHKKARQMQSLTKTKKDEILKSPNAYTLISFEEDLNAISKILDTHTNNIADKYKQIAQASKNFDDNTIYDKRYDIHNKKYLLSALDTELGSIKNFGHDSSILAIKTDEDSISKIKLQKDNILIAKTVAKMILRTSRRSDVIAHYEDGVFIMILKYANMKQAAQAAQRIKDMTLAANFILDSQEIDVKTNTAIAKIDSDMTKEQIIISALDQL